jgi:glycosyltransferase involved in cell wall biosynthesis
VRREPEVGDNARRELRLLVLARNYPNPEFPVLGLWTQGLVRCATSFAQVKVIAPVAYAPPLPPLRQLAEYRRHRGVPSRRFDGDVEILHPRMLVGPGYSTHQLESLSYGAAVAPLMRRLRRRFPFDLIHAHFTYPDGVVACWLGARYGVPVVISEHAPWLPWMERYPLVRRQACWAASTCRAHLPVSEHVRRSIREVTRGRSEPAEPVPVAVDGGVFRPAEGSRRKRDQLLFVGVVRRAKGADVLVQALREVARHRPGVRLLLVGDPFYRSYRRDAEQVLALAREIGVADRVQVLGPKSPPEVAELMAESELLVLPSRRESFGAVLIEALACGIPVVATRSGGPEEIIDSPALGRLVPPEDPLGLARALVDVLENRGRYDAHELRRHAIERYGTQVVGARLAAHYSDARANGARPAGGG